MLAGLGCPLATTGGNNEYECKYHHCHRHHRHFFSNSQGGPGWHLPGGPVGMPARWAVASNVEGTGSGTEKEAQGPQLGMEGPRINYLLGPRVLSSPLLVRPVCL